MSRLTIAERREKQVESLLRFRTDSPTDVERREAHRLMNSYYRLCGLCETNLYLSNDSRMHNKASTIYSCERENKWYKRLSDQFKAFCGLELVYCGYYPSIGIRSPQGGFSEKVYGIFYERSCNY